MSMASNKRNHKSTEPKKTKVAKANAKQAVSFAAPQSSMHSSDRDGPIIGIIGIAGRYGKWMQERFAELGYDVIGSDQWLTPKQLVQQAEVVIFSVPIEQTVEIIDSVSKVSRPQQLWIDITSLKEAPLKAMLRSKADVIGLHPMCGPDLPNWNGQTVALCYGRLQNPNWEIFVIDFLNSMKAKYYVTDPIEHDRIMAYVQALPHALSMMMIGTFQTMEDHGLSVSEIEHYATPPYRLSVAAMARILATNPNLYADIQISNRKHTLEVLKSLRDQAEQIYQAVRNSDKRSLVERLTKGRQQFRSRNIQSGMKGFLQMSRVMADFSTSNSKVIHTRRDQPGLLEQILKILASNQVNLTGLHSFKSDEYDGFSFHLGLEGPPDSIALQRALCDIRNHQQLRDLVVIEEP